MNYKAELRGWCIDRATRICEINGSKPSVDEVMQMADKLCEYAYVPNKDLADTLAYLFEMVRNSPKNESKIEAIIGTLEHIYEDRMRQGLEKTDKEETVQ